MEPELEHQTYKKNAILTTNWLQFFVCFGNHQKIYEITKS